MKNLFEKIVDLIVFGIIAAVGGFLAYWCITFAYTAIKAIFFN